MPLISWRATRLTGGGSAFQIKVRRMNFLLTNDDGVTAPGLWAAARALADFGKVLIVAPAANCSGFGAAYPPGQTLAYFSYHNGADHPDGVTAFGLSATPATCVHVGLNGLLDIGDVDLVVSGVNDGANMGRDVLYSGTVGAALTATLLGKPAVAFSLAVEPPERPCWESAERAVREMVAAWLRDAQNPRRGLPVAHNVNIPNRAPGALRGQHMTILGDRSFLSQYRFERAPGQPNMLVVQRREDPAPGLPDLWSDAWAVSQGYISVTPLRLVPDVLHVDGPLIEMPAPERVAFAAG